MSRPIAIGCVALVLFAACQGPAASSPPAAETVAATPAATATGVPPTTLPTATSSLVVLPGRLLFSRFVEATHTFQASFISRPDGSEETEVPRPWTEGLFRWSRSGTEIVVGTQLADGRVGTAIVDADGKVLRILEIPDPTLNLPCGVWSLDDARLACEGWDDADPSRHGIYSIRASDGGDLQQLTSTPEGMTDFGGDYSTSGQFIFKRGAEDEGDGPLMLLDPAGGAPRQLGTGTFGDPGRFSPDGASVLTGAGGQIIILDLEGKNLGTIAESGAFLFGAAWSPDGTHIVFSRAVSGPFADLFTSLPDGSDRQQVTRTPANEINVDWGVDPS